MATACARQTWTMTQTSLVSQHSTAQHSTKCAIRHSRSQPRTQRQRQPQHGNSSTHPSNKPPSSAPPQHQPSRQRQASQRQARKASALNSITH